MFVQCSSNSDKIIHVPGCPLIRSSKPSDLVQVQDVEHMVFHGYSMCSCCNPIDRMFQKEKSEIHTFCRNNGLWYSYHNEYIDIKSRCGEWRILVADNKCWSTLYHRHKKSTSLATPAPMSDFHQERVCYYALLPYFQHIQYHDNSAVHNAGKGQPQRPAIAGTKRYRQQKWIEKKKEKARSAREVAKLIDKVRAEDSARGRTQ